MMLDIPWDSAITKNPLRLADAIELAVAFSKEDYNGRFTLGHFQHLVVSENLIDDDKSFPPEDEADERNEQYEQAEALSDDDQVLHPGDKADERNRQYEQAVALIKNRASWLGDAYPFSVEDNEVRFSPQSSIDKVLPYLFFLVCSNSNFVPSLKNALPTDFENLCKYAFQALFPDWAEVVLFSQKSEDRKEIFGLAANEAVPKLAEKLNAVLINDGEQIPSTRREFGIDIIAICPFGDQVPYPFFAFAQCTIQQEWWNKKHEAKADTGLTGFIHINARHSNFLMIPHFPRYNLEKWREDLSRTGDCIICDRFRLCVLLEKSASFKHDDPPASVAPVFKTLKQNLVQPFVSASA